MVDATQRITYKDHINRHTRNNAMSLFAKIILLAYFGVFCYCLGKFTYLNGDGYGFFVPHVGGYHVSTLEE